MFFLSALFIFAEGLPSLFGGDGSRRPKRSSGELGDALSDYLNIFLKLRIPLFHSSQKWPQIPILLNILGVMAFFRFFGSAGCALFIFEEELHSLFGGDGSRRP